MEKNSDQYEIGLVTQSIDLASKGLEAVNKAIQQHELNSITAYRAAVCIYDSTKQSFRVIASGDQWSGDFQQARKEIRKTTPSHCWRIESESPSKTTELSYLNLLNPQNAKQYHEDVPNGKKDDPTVLEIGIPILNAKSRLAGILMIDLSESGPQTVSSLPTRFKEDIEEYFKKNSSFIESARLFNHYHEAYEILNRSRIESIIANMSKNWESEKPVIQFSEIESIANAIEVESITYYEPSKSNPSEFTKQGSYGENELPNDFNLKSDARERKRNPDTRKSLIDAILNGTKEISDGSNFNRGVVEIKTDKGSGKIVFFESKQKVRKYQYPTHTIIGLFIIQTAEISNPKMALLTIIGEHLAFLASRDQQRTMKKLRTDFHALVINSVLSPRESTIPDTPEDEHFLNSYCNLLQDAIGLRFMMILEVCQLSTVSKPKKLEVEIQKPRIIFSSMDCENDTRNLYNQIVAKINNYKPFIKQDVFHCHPKDFLELENGLHGIETWLLETQNSGTRYWFVISVNYLSGKSKDLLIELCQQCTKIMTKLGREHINREIKLIDEILVNHIEDFKSKRDSFLYDAVKPKQKTTLGLISDKFQSLFRRLLGDTPTYQIQVFCIPWPKTGLGDFVYSGTEFTEIDDLTTTPYREYRLSDAVKGKLGINTQSSPGESEEVTYAFPTTEMNRQIATKDNSVFEFLDKSTVLVKIPSGFFVLCIAITSIPEGLTNPFFRLSRVEDICCGCFELFQLKRRFYDLEEHVLSQPAHQLLTTFAHDAIKNISIAKGKSAASAGCKNCKEVSVLLEKVHQTHTKILQDFEQDESVTTSQRCDLQNVLKRLIETEFNGEISFLSSLPSKTEVDLPVHAVEGIHRQVLNNAIRNSNNGKAELILDAGVCIVDGLHSAIASVRVRNPVRSSETGKSRKGLGLTIGSMYNKGRFLLSNAVEDGFFTVTIIFVVKTKETIS